MTDDLIELADKPVEDPGTGQSVGRVDGKNRYMIPDPDTGKPARWTRATSFAKAIAETENLQRWGERMAIKGLMERPDLAARTERLPVDRKRELDGIVRDAKTAAGAWKKAGYGTTFHKLTERVDLGDLDPFVAGPPWGAMLRAYVQLIANAGIKIRREYIEGTVVVKKYKVAGTFDRIVEMPSGELWVADVKTGRDLSWSWGEISIQLALYAHADAIYDFETAQFLDMPLVNQEQALVIHAPVEGDHVSLERVNIQAGWEAAELCAKVRSWRAFKNLAAQATRLQVEDDGPDLPRKWVGRIEAALTVSDLSLVWKEASEAGEWTDVLTELGQERRKEIER